MSHHNFVIAIGRNRMGAGSDELGELLLKGYIFTLTEMENPPSSILLFNKAAYLACEGSNALEDLAKLEARGCDIQVCGTCLNYFELEEKLKVGRKSNMQNISLAMADADKLINL